MRKRKFTIVLGVAAVLVSSLVGASAVRTPDAGATDIGGVATDVVAGAQEQLDELPTIDLNVVPPDPVVGPVNETLILVIAGRAPSLAEAQSRLEEVNTHFGKLQGFYLDEARHYDVTGLLVETSPETVSVPCAPAEDGHSTIDCPEDADSVAELQHATLELVDKGQLSTAVLPSCEDVGLALCRESYLTTLTDDVVFSATDWLLVTAFRTKQGAEEFLDLSRAVGLGGLVAVQAVKLGGGDVGLGQEPHPDGSGPLLGPLDDQAAYQR